MILTKKEFHKETLFFISYRLFSKKKAKIKLFDFKPQTQSQNTNNNNGSQPHTPYDFYKQPNHSKDNIHSCCKFQKARNFPVKIFLRKRLRSPVVIKEYCQSQQQQCYQQTAKHHNKIHKHVFLVFIISLTIMS